MLIYLHIYIGQPQQALPRSVGAQRRRVGGERLHKGPGGNAILGSGTPACSDRLGFRLRDVKGLGFRLRDVKGLGFGV